jgi:hypothetical protein
VFSRGRHRVIERILDFRPSNGCWLTLDPSAPTTLHVMPHRIGPISGEPTEAEAGRSVHDVCPDRPPGRREPDQPRQRSARMWVVNVIPPTE